MVGVVDLQDFDSGPSCWSESAQTGTCPPEVLHPPILPWVKEAHDCVGPWIEASDIGTLVGIAGKTRQSEVIELSRATVFQSYNVVNLEWDGV